MRMLATDYLSALQAKVGRATTAIEHAYAFGDLAFTEMRMGKVEMAELKLAEIARAAQAERQPEITALHFYLTGAFDIYAGRMTASLQQLLSAQHFAQQSGAQHIEARSRAAQEDGTDN